METSGSTPGGTPGGGSGSNGAKAAQEDPLAVGGSSVAAGYVAVASRPRSATGRAPWWLSLALGLLALAFGFVLLSWPLLDVVVFQMLVGVWLLGDGFTRVAGALLVREGRGAGETIFSALVGVLLIVTAALCLRGLVTTLVLVVVFLSLKWLLTGFGDLMAAVTSVAGHPRGRGWLITSGVLAVAVGVGFLLLPELSLAGVEPVTAFSSIGVGLVQVVVAFGLRAAQARTPAPEVDSGG
jgi:uncharacterized membrane protein HdeD (DUF308 family)